MHVTNFMCTKLKIFVALTTQIVYIDCVECETEKDER
jgi:hypothetical protein